MPSTQLPDGRWEHTFSASWLTNFATCPEQARQRYLKLTPFTANDYTALGNGMHRAFEVSLQARIDGREITQEEACAAALAKFEEIAAEPGFEYKKWTHDSAITQMYQHIETFWAEIMPIAQPLAVEKEFNLPLLNDTFRSINLRGFIDCVDAELGVIDWKSAGSPYKQWEKERYEKQPTVYAWAENTDAMRYVVFVHGKAPQTFVVPRNDGHIEWLKRQALAAARLIEANISVWPMVDSGWHCSPKWCNAWATCRGQFLGDQPW
jgi:PD-(D/E)XK nuclease superfamily protein